MIRVRTSDSEPIPYAYISIYSDGSSVSLRDSVTQVPMTNPGWAYLDVNGEYRLDLKSASGSPESFDLKVVVGSVVGDKSITQQAP